MGFTRYWTRPRELDRHKFADFSRDCEKSCVAYSVVLRNAYFSPEEIRFEGNPGCEPFTIERLSRGRERGGRVMEFCKTQQLPYDEAVASCLHALRSHFPDVEIPAPS